MREPINLKMMFIVTKQNHTSMNYFQLCVDVNKQVSDTMFIYRIAFVPLKNCLVFVTLSYAQTILLSVAYDKKYLD